MLYDDDSAPATKGDMRLLKRDMRSMKKEIRKDMQKIIRILLQEIADTRLELKEDINGLDQKFSSAFSGLNGKVDKLTSEFQAFRIQTNQNFVVFMNNQKGLGDRVTVLEAAR